MKCNRFNPFFRVLVKRSRALVTRCANLLIKWNRKQIYRGEIYGNTSYRVSLSSLSFPPFFTRISNIVKHFHTGMIFPCFPVIFPFSLLLPALANLNIVHLSKNSVQIKVQVYGLKWNSLKLLLRFH